uniref:Myb-like domain-containing protein n=1 Tax=Pseudo-nitzschia australis TaxID=44445 RepID=A0A7S4A8L5_9STRA|mmetsp:Transcript_4994/g.11106  ORF Transcript_4994/g.11106 Transcript_4994/m.11106 type:complete len:297 (-) Transcript_4994:290-1180(-)|eukprot:CAMPEP_0168227614 /NCGR_PEP_ID=MMETSP0140_2-20121125/14146_1 /TAXON_ID=44445 /ORGANISM="Pseudo-nitzschia australis, Strain 10249 10 AB" /LENGTH=296 /DNA_ID=CAMNT_0008158991 /DNA_START=47 /DNA_END=937 /DNA_ORIENTATION=+
MSAALSRSKRKTQEDIHSHYDEPTTAKMKHAHEGERHAYDFTATNQNNADHNNARNDNRDDWTEEQHRNFVSTIFEIGLKNASPAIVLENMTQKMETITSERVKSKLQKYRSKKNKDKSKEEFMENYCAFLERIKSIQASSSPGTGMAIHDHQHGVDSSSSDPLLSQLLETTNSSNGSDRKILLGGDVAGYLTHAVMKDNMEKKIVDGRLSPDGTASTSVLSTNVLRKGARDYVENYAGSAIKFPILTESEKKSSLGIAMTFIAGLFLTMSQHLTRERARAETIGLKLLSSTTSQC